MHIGEIVKRTGLTKKTIYYYVNERLISPSRDSRNGYLIFTESDLKNLQIISKLRLLGLSVENIRNIMSFASTASYYFIRRLKELDREKASLEWRQTALKNILDSLNPAPDRDEIFSQLTALTAIEPENLTNGPIDTTDARLIAAYFWGNFMRGIELSEYRRFLWSRLINYIVMHQSSELIGFRNYLYSLSKQETQEVFAKRNEHIERVASLSEGDYAAFISEMLAAIAQNLKKASYIKLWKSRYRQFIHPSTIFFDSPAGDIMREFSPRFLSYQRNINYCCAGVLKYLESPDGDALRAELQDKLNGYISIAANHSGDLAAFYSFQSMAE